MSEQPDLNRQSLSYCRTAATLAVLILIGVPAVLLLVAAALLVGYLVIYGPPNAIL